jgi:hypothetical protein
VKRATRGQDSPPGLDPRSLARQQDKLGRLVDKAPSPRWPRAATKALRVAAGALCAAGAQALKLAFLGDSGAELSGSGGFYAKAVLNMIQAAGVSLVLHDGDLDYNSSPST